jgi:hypothetical protein
MRDNEDFTSMLKKKEEILDNAEKKINSTAHAP